MKRLKQFVACLFFLASLSWGQTTTPPAPGTFSQVNLPLLASLPPVSNANTAVVGNPGNSTYYYWLVTNYTLGQSSPQGPFIVTSAPAVLTGSNYITITPQYLVGATVDVLRTTSISPPTGTGNYAVATGNTSGTINDQGGSLGSYTIAPVTPQNFGLSLANEVVGAGASHLILRQNNVFVADLSASSAGGITGATPNGGLIQTGTTLGLNTAGCVPTNVYGFIGPGFGCVAAGAGTTNNALQYSLPYYSSAGTSNILSGITPPTTNGNWILAYSVTSNAAVAPAMTQAGVAARAVVGTTSTDTILYSDNTSRVSYQGSVAVAVSLPTPTTLGNQTFATRLTNSTTGAGTLVTVTPTTLQITNGSALASTLIIPQNTSCLITVDTSGSFWNTDCSPTILFLSGAAPTADGSFGFDFTTHSLMIGSNGNTLAEAVSASGAGSTATTCTNQVITAISSIAAPTCTTLTAAFLPNAAGGTVLGNNSGTTGVVSYTNTVVLGIPNSTAGGLQVNSSTSSTLGYKLTDLSGLQTLGTNEPLVLAPNGTGYVQINNAGTNAAPSLVLTDTTTGFWRDASGNWDWSSGGTSIMRFRSVGLEILSSGLFGFGSGAATTAVDTTACRLGAGALEFGSGTSCGANGFFKSAQTIAVTGADVTCGTGGTIASCTAFQTITGLSLTLPSFAANWDFECDLVVSQATAAAANQIGVQTATNGATNLTAAAIAYTAAGTATAAAITDVASTTTAQSVVTFTPGATGTKLPIHLAGSIEGASASGTVLNITVLTGAAADLLTIYRGSKCWVH
jgi:trimeric autotransporter adhesin